MTTTTETAARVEELRTAAKTLRCGDHRFPLNQPPGGLHKPGVCLNCGIHILDAIDIPDALVEPLAAWLKSAAELARTHETDPSYDTGHGFRWCVECNNEECDMLGHIDKALTVARVINGKAVTR